MDNDEVFPLSGTLIIDFGENESVTVIDLETNETSDIPLVNQCPH